MLYESLNPGAKAVTGPANIVCFTFRVPPTHLLCSFRFLSALQQRKAQSKLLYLLSTVMEDFKFFLANQQCINQIKKCLGLEKLRDLMM